MKLNDFNKMGVLMENVINTTKSKQNSNNLEYVVESKQYPNTYYGIIREGDNKLYLKIAKNVNDKLCVEHFSDFYYGNTQMHKSKLENLNLGKKKINILLSEEKYVIAEPLEDEEFSSGGEDFNVEDLEGVDGEDMEADLEGDSDVELQDDNISSLVGKLGYELGQYSEDDYGDVAKGAVKSILARVSLEKMSEEDKTDLVSYLTDFLEEKQDEQPVEDEMEDDNGGEPIEDESPEDEVTEVTLNDDYDPFDTRIEDAYDDKVEAEAEKDEINDYNKYELIFKLNDFSLLDKNILEALKNEEYKNALNLLRPLFTYDDESNEKTSIDVGENYDHTYEDSDGHLLAYTLRGSQPELAIFFDRNLYENDEWWTSTNESNCEDEQEPLYDFKMLDDEELVNDIKSILDEDWEDDEDSVDSYLRQLDMKEKKKKARLEQEPDYKYYGKIPDDEEYEDEYDENYNPFKK